jgi:hypothetical protein
MAVWRESCCLIRSALAPEQALRSCSICIMHQLAMPLSRSLGSSSSTFGLSSFLQSIRTLILPALAALHNFIWQLEYASDPEKIHMYDDQLLDFAWPNGSLSHG